jgi:hypothetical protein
MNGKREAGSGKQLAWLANAGTTRVPHCSLPASRFSLARSV